MDEKEKRFVRKLSYYDAIINYYKKKRELLIVERCVEQNFEEAIKVNKEYFDEEKSILSVYNKKKKFQKYCIQNIKNKKILSDELDIAKKKLMKTKDKLDK